MNRKQRRAARADTHWQASDTPISVEEIQRQSDVLVMKIRKQLQGNHFHVQAMTLAELVGLHLAGHPAVMREAVLTAILENAVGFCEMWKHVLHGPGGHHPSDVMPTTSEARQ